MNKSDKENLITLLKIFKNRPYHLAKYLIDNFAFTDVFLEKIRSSQKLSQLQNKLQQDPEFKSISDMEEFYNSLIEEEINMKGDIEKMTQECNSKLEKLVNSEKYEEAAILRDFMKKMGIKKN